MPRSLFLFCAAAALLSAQESPPPSPALIEYEGRTIAQTMHWSGASWLVRHKREREESALEMRRELRVQPGMSVCDMGCGNGYHTLPLAAAVGEKGRVYAVDVQPEMIAMLRKRVEEKKILNVQPIEGRFDDPCLPPDSCDLILLVDVYHEFSHPQPMLTGMRTALKKDGLIALVEFREEDASVPIKPEHKMSKVQILKEMTANGFELRREYDALPWQHLMFFGKAAEKR
jgi:ubiquinone/menaquinone biosynthesis C-methylase UbiE